MEIPIACSLDASAARAQLGEWKEIFALVVTRVERISPSRLEASVRAQSPGLSELLQLAQREKACCPFFDFSLIIDATATTFVVVVPDDASSVLDEFVVSIS